MSQLNNDHPLNGSSRSPAGTISPEAALRGLFARNQDPQTARELRLLVENTMSSRFQWMQKMMDPRRDIEDECGYPRLGDAIEVETYRELYEREAVACRVVQVMPRESWQSQPLIYEDEDSEDVTEFEEAWDELGQSLVSGGVSWHQTEEGSAIWPELLNADILSGIGHFGIILVGIDDGRNLQEPADGVVDTVRNTYRLEKFEKEVIVRNESEYLVNEQGERYWPNQYTKKVWGTRAVKSGTYKIMPDCEPTANEVKVLDEMVSSAQVTVNVSRQDAKGWHTDSESRQANFLNSWRQPEKPPPTSNRVKTSSGAALDGTDRQYGDAWGMGMGAPASFGSGPNTDMSGTEQQYFGAMPGPTEMPAEKPSKQKRKITFLRSFDESLVQVVRWEWNGNNPRFGRPVMYRVTLNDPRDQHSGVGLPLATVFVHWSRIVHLADTGNVAGSSQVFAAPRMRPVLNNILGLRKLYGASSEGYWKSCFAGVVFSSHPQLGGDPDIDINKLRDTVENYQNGLQRALVATGGAWSTLAPTVVDPTPFITVHLQAICIVLGMPLRVFEGSERGELASSQDDASWNDRLRGRQQYYVTPKVIVPFINLLISMGVLPEPEGYTVEWPDLDSLTDTDKATIANTKTTALGAYVSQGVEALIGPHDYLTRILDFTEEQAEEIIEAVQKAHEDQETMTMPPQIQGQDAAPPPGTAADQQVKQQAEQAKQQAAALAKSKPGAPGGPPATPIKVKPGEKLVHPASVKPPTGNQSLLSNESTGEVASWITVGGQHIPLGKGQDKGEAVREHFARLKAKQDDHGEGHGHGKHGHEGHNDHHGGGAALEHAAHEYHTAHDIHHVAEALGGHAEAHGAVAEAHHAAESAHAAHEAHGAHDVHESHGLDAAAVVARNLYGPALKAASYVVSKVPGGRAAAEKITKAHDTATKVAETAVKKLEERYGKATAAAILGAGTLTAGAVTKAAGLGSVGKALPGQKFIGAVPYVALAEVGRRVGLIGPDTKIEKGLETVGTWVHAARAAVGKPFRAAGAAASQAGLKGAKLAGKGVRKLTGNEELTMNDGDEKVTLTPEELRKAHDEFMKEFTKSTEDSDSESSDEEE